MFLPSSSRYSGSWGFPRVSGDVPNCERRRGVDSLFSPRERGCSQAGVDVKELSKVFPA